MYYFIYLKKRNAYKKYISKQLKYLSVMFHRHGDRIEEDGGHDWHFEAIWFAELNDQFSFHVKPLFPWIPFAIATIIIVVAIGIIASIFIICITVVENAMLVSAELFTDQIGTAFRVADRSVPTIGIVHHVGLGIVRSVKLTEWRVPWYGRQRRLRL